VFDCSFILIYNMLTLYCLVLNIKFRRNKKEKLRVNCGIYSLILCCRELRAVNRSELKIIIKKIFTIKHPC